MDDSDFLCPLCCEELDISDRNFYPCKCGYQVCMWCWHRIRESESGLCPACRTPYGDDPHEFSAVDVEEVLKANKEKAAADKMKNANANHHHSKGGGGDGCTHHHHLSSSGNSEQDRTALANMRVIRRNLVYAVGLPPLSEELLRKADYFGQYGKVNKIVLNRNNPPAGDARRASASAYVTFIHKEDTLSCILALDGFYMDGRNIRASYGTSKYCSAFIKNVRCNNPECTYLHSMGEKEDTFTKQEIQAGYVTSGRDVLERQQQTGARRRVGGGGPSGTGKASASPVFPPPTYEEPPKPPSLVPAVPRGQAKLSRATSLADTSPPHAMGMVRSKSIGTTTAASVVAGMHAAEPSAAPPTRTTTLTPLTPLKPRTSVSTKQKLLQEIPRKPTAGSSCGAIGASGGSIPAASVTAAAPVSKNDDLIGGAVIGGPSLGGGGRGLIGGIPQGSVGGVGTGSSLLGGEIIGGSNRLIGLGGDVYTGDLSSSSIIGGDKWGGPPIHGGVLDSNDSFNSGGVIGGSKKNMGFGAIGSGSIGGSAIGSSYGSQHNNAGSSTLASMLGINLPSGSGSLANDGSNPFFQQGGAIGGPMRGGVPMGSGMSNSLSGSMGAIGSGAIGSNNPQRGGVIGAPGGNPNAPIGGMAIGGGRAAPGGNGNGGSQSDIALLQSLLPGVHITSGQGQQQQQQILNNNNNFGTVGSNNWNSGVQPNGRPDKTWNSGGGGGFQAAPGGGVIGAPKPQQQQQSQQQSQQQQSQQQQQQQNRNSNIW